MMTDKEMIQRVKRLEKTDKLLKEVDHLTTEIIRKYPTSEPIIEDIRLAISKIDEVLKIALFNYELRDTLKKLRSNLEVMALR